MESVVLCWLSLAWKLLVKLSFLRPWPSKTEAWAMLIGLGQLRPWPMRKILTSRYHDNVLCYSDQWSKAQVLTTMVLAMLQETCLRVRINTKHYKKNRTQRNPGNIQLYQPPKPSAWAVALCFWDMKLEPWAITSWSDGLSWPWLLSAWFSWLKALSLSWHNTRNQSNYLFRFLPHHYIIYPPEILKIVGDNKLYVSLIYCFIFCFYGCIYFSCFIGLVIVHTY